jgi:hypothetical protein
MFPVSAAMVGSAPSILPSERMVSIRSRLFAVGQLRARDVSELHAVLS